MDKAPPFSSRAAKLALLLCALSIGSSASAWNSKGHMTVAAVAWKNMTPASRAKASALLRLNPDYRVWVRGVPAADVDVTAFLRAATWPDQIRGTYVEDGSSPPGLPTDARNIGYADCLKHRYWHFRDIPFSQDGTALEEPKVPDALTQIRTFSAAIANPSTSDDIKSYDLAWLLHLVGDVHQPLHATSRFASSTRHGDNGGNSVSFCMQRHNCSTLHGFWDAALGTSDSPASALRLACVGAPIPGSHCLTEAPAAEVAIGDPGTWVLESFELARSVAYQRPVGPGKGPYYANDRYKAKVGSTAETQVALGGARLARLLDQILASGVTGTVSAPPLPTATTCPRLH